MGSFFHDSFVFTALNDFRAEDDPNLQLASAHEFGIRIIACNGLRRDDWRVISGPFWRFRTRAREVIMGDDPRHEFFIRRIETADNPTIRLFYFDLKTQQDAIVEIRCRPGLAMTFRSGKNPNYRLDVYSMCSHENQLSFLSNGDKFMVD